MNLLRRGIISSGVLDAAPMFSTNFANLNGTDQCLELADGVFDPTSTFSVSMILKTGSDISTGQWPMASYRLTDNRGIGAEISGGDLYVYSSDSISSAFSLSTNTFYYLTWIFDDAGSDVDIYINSSLHATLTQSPSAGTYNMRLGCRKWSTTNTNFAEVGVAAFSYHTRAISTGEIPNSFKCFGTLSTAYKVNLESYNELANWTDHTGEELDDQTGNGNNLTNVGSTPFNGTGLDVSCSE